MHEQDTGRAHHAASHSGNTCLEPATAWDVSRHVWGTACFRDMGFALRRRAVYYCNNCNSVKPPSPTVLWHWPVAIIGGSCDGSMMLVVVQKPLRSRTKVTTVCFMMVQACSGKFMLVASLTNGLADQNSVVIGRLMEHTDYSGHLSEWSKSQQSGQ